MRRLLMAVVALTALSAAPAAALPAATTADWGCAGIALVGGICVNDPFALLPL